MDARSAYNWLLSHNKETSYLKSATELLAWDQRTYMPQGGAAHRAEQLASFARIIHGRDTDPRIEEHLATIESSALVSDAAATESVNTRVWRRQYDRIKNIPEKLAVAYARACSDGENTWVEARQKNDWNSLAPKLESLLSLQKERASAIGFENEPYDALLGDYEPGMTAEQLVPIFENLRSFLVGLLERIENSSVPSKRSILERTFPIADQEAFAKDMVEKLGFNFNQGRLDISAHPFSLTIGPGDSRITTRFQENFFNTAFFGTAHEAGHGMYEQGLPQEHWGSPKGTAVSLGVHESQSRLWENMVCRSKSFWDDAFPIAQQRFDALKDVSLRDFTLAINEVSPSLVRLEADEVTYNLHIALRFELELDLMRGNLSVRDLPEAWNNKMSDYLGLTPKSHAEGVMQDIHWNAGAIGYFPTYTLGNLYAAQLMEAADKDCHNLQRSFSNGQFTELVIWLKDNVHSAGSSHSPVELIENVTGKFPSADALIHYLGAKFTELYNV